MGWRGAWPYCSPMQGVSSQCVNQGGLFSQALLKASCFYAPQLSDQENNAVRVRSDQHPPLHSSWLHLKTLWGYRSASVSTAKAPVPLPPQLHGFSGNQLPSPASIRLFVAMPGCSLAPVQPPRCASSARLCSHFGWERLWLFYRLNSSWAGQTVCNYNIFAGHENHFLPNAGEHRRQPCWGGGGGGLELQCFLASSGQGAAFFDGWAPKRADLTAFACHIIHTELSCQGSSRGTLELHPSAHSSLPLFHPCGWCQADSCCTVCGPLPALGCPGGIFFRTGY